MNGHETDTKTPERIKIARLYNDLGGLLGFLVMEAGLAGPTDFSSAISRTGVDPKTVRTWLKNEHRPNSNQFKQIKKYFASRGLIDSRSEILSILNHLYNIAGRSKLDKLSLDEALTRLCELECDFDKHPAESITFSSQGLHDWIELRRRVFDMTVRMQDCDNLSHRFAELFKLRHWNDKPSAMRKSVYIELGAQIIERLHDRNSTGSLRFILFYINICNINSRPDDAASALTLLPAYMPALKANQMNTLIARQTDTLLETAGVTAEILCDWVGSEVPQLTALRRAGVQRCQACLAVRKGDFTTARDAIDRARSHLGSAPLGGEHQSITNYLDMLEIATEWQERREPSVDLDRRIMSTLSSIEDLDQRDGPLIAALWSIFLQSNQQPRVIDHQNSEVRLLRLRQAALAIDYQREKSIPVFCAFDMRLINRLAKDITNRNK